SVLVAGVCTASVLAFLVFFGGLDVAAGYREAFHAAEYLQKNELMFRTDAALMSQFINAFRPSREDVQKILFKAALGVLEAHNAKEDFYHRGLQYGPSGDPEERLSAMDAEFLTRTAALEDEVKCNLVEFRRLRDLAVRCSGYVMPESWKEYVSESALQ
ncbi:MAG TPA: hypothetical protein VMJ72_02225, partial [Candidatus Paceibacterota bacterium]|nr:hypothetical protein [Candidatus Paceibacterota bacterium]